MEQASKNILSVYTVLIIILMIQACAGSEGVAGDSAGSREYAKDFDDIKSVVERAIEGSNINIDNVLRSDDKNKITLIINRVRFVDGKEVQQEQGKVRIIKLGDQKSKVEVDNPDYHFSVPDRERQDYQRIIFKRIEYILDT